MTVRAAVGLGSNVGDRIGHIRAAIVGLERTGHVTAVSPLYETEPIGVEGQPPYVNAVVIVETELVPRELLATLLTIEREQGRERRERWGPRTLDLDLLLYGGDAIDEPGLKVPHPEFHRRRFVLEPLLEVWPNARLPDGRLVAEFVDDVADQGVHVLPGSPMSTRVAVFIVFMSTGALAVLIWWLLGQFLP